MNNINYFNTLLMYPDCSDEILYTVSKGSVIYFENELKSKSIILILNEFNESDLYLKIQEVHSKFKCSFSCKVIGNDKLNNSLINLLKQKNITILKNIVRDDQFDIVYYSKFNKLRLSKNLKSNLKVQKIKTLIVDDSPTIRTLLTKILENSDKFSIVGSLGDPLEVEKFLNNNSVDLITLDIHMPGLNGVQLLKKIYPLFHIPTVMISSIRIEEGPYIMEALEFGAVDYIEKPSLSELNSITPYILEKLNAAASSKKHSKQKNQNILLPTKQIVQDYKYQSLIVIGSSTGGVEALKKILEVMPDKIPPIIIVQHIPEVFSKAFAIRLNRLCKFEVKEAEDREVVKSNIVYIAPGGKHLKILDYSGELRVNLSMGEKVNRFRPSVDVMFHSISELEMSNIVGVLLTGMGRDGAKGLLALRNAGATTIAQDEESCTVFGMPKEAIEMNAADHIVSLNDIPEKMIKLLEK